jgi:heme/copper-type cytochrome/quinol oxidase subunit 1
MASIHYPLDQARSSSFSFSEWMYGWVATVDHKRLGLMYVAASLGFFLVAGLMASVMRLQLAFPESHGRTGHI